MFNKILRRVSFFSLRNRYIPALLIIVFLASLGFVNVNDIISSIENEGKIINVSGRQRMLSQKLILLADDYIKEPNLKNKNELLENILLMEKSHEFLLNKRLNSIIEKTDIKDNFDKKIKDYLQNFRNIIKNKNTKDLKLLKKDSQRLLLKLDEIVKVYEDELDNKLEVLQERGLYLFLSILLVLFLEGIFIFRPASRKIHENTKFLEIAVKEKTKELEKLNKNLEKKIAKEVEKNRENEMHLMEHAKMISIGELIGNIAHQWRQPLSAISTAASGIKVQKEFGNLNDEFLESMLEAIVRNTQNLSQTIETFKEFIKEDEFEEEVVLQERVENVLKIVNDSLQNHNIELIKVFSDENPIKIKLVAAKLSQVLINILNNAKEALVKNKVQKPWIKIVLEKTNKEIIISVEDNAGGVAKENLAKVFDPYFTTKHQSQGTGLGLHISYKIVTEIFKAKLYVKNSEYGAKFFIVFDLDKE